MFVSKTGQEKVKYLTLKALHLSKGKLDKFPYCVCVLFMTSYSRLTCCTLFCRSINSIKGELIPYLVKKQFQKNKRRIKYPLGADTASVSVGGPEDTKTGK